VRSTARTDVALTALIGSRTLRSASIQSAFPSNWTTAGNATVANDTITLHDDSSLNPGVFQTFTVPAGVTTFGFTVSGAGFVANAANQPPDAFEAALLDSSTGLSVIPTPPNLSQSDAFLNVQGSGEVYFGSTTTVSGRSTSGQGGSLTTP